MSHSSKEAAVLATVSVAEAALEKRLLRLRDDGAPSAIEAAASEQQPCGTCCKQMAVTLVTNEAEAVREAEEDRLAVEAAEAEWQRSQNRKVLLEIS